jgi:hypothetical protein
MIYKFHVTFKKAAALHEPPAPVFPTLFKSANWDSVQIEIREYVRNSLNHLLVLFLKNWLS